MYLTPNWQLLAQPGFYVAVALVGLFVAFLRWLYRFNAPQNIKNNDKIYSASKLVSDLQLLTGTLDDLNIYYTSVVENGGQRTIITLEEDPDWSSSKVKYKGYLGFAYIFVFEEEVLVAAGGYE